MVTSPKSSMRLFILGATGGTGRALIDQALEELEHRAHVHRIVGMASVKGSASQATAETRSPV